MSKRILVTGATGKVGQAFIARLLADPAHAGTVVRALCHNRKLAARDRLEVFSGSIDGHLRAFSTANGAIIWDFDTVGPKKTVNEVPARGGSLNGPGPAIAGGMLFVESGYAANGIPGNVLLAFSVDGK